MQSPLVCGFEHVDSRCSYVSIVLLGQRVHTTGETVTTATEFQHKTIEGFCGFGRVVGVIL